MECELAENLGRPLLAQRFWDYPYVSCNKLRCDPRDCVLGEPLPTVFGPMDVSLRRCDISMSQRSHDLTCRRTIHRHVGRQRMAEAMKVKR